MRLSLEVMHRRRRHCRSQQELHDTVEAQNLVEDGPCQAISQRLVVLFDAPFRFDGDLMV